MGAPASTVYGWCRRGTRVGGTPVRLRHVRRGNCIFVPVDAIKEFEQACTQAGLIEEDGDYGPRMTNAQRQADLEALDAEARQEGL